jgi:tetratricopeptide (TPR) repeat protein
MFDALKTNCSLHQQQGNLDPAIAFAEEAYNLVAEAYDPVHPEVQVAAGILINLLTKKGGKSLIDAERFAEATYSSLRNKNNGIVQDKGEMATSAYNLAYVIFRMKGDLLKAEGLVKEALRLHSLINNDDHCNIGVDCSLLARILQAQHKLGDETKGLFERSIAISTRNEGINGENRAIGNYHFAKFYQELAKIQPSVESTRKQLILSKSFFNEVFIYKYIRIYIYMNIYTYVYIYI